MNKSKTIFAQIMSLINEYKFKKCVDRYRGDRHAIKFNCRDQFLVMSFAQFTDHSGLRDIETTLDLCAQDLYRPRLLTVYRFLTNNFTLEAITIAELYRDRWQIEILFKWIKQHLHIKTFYGTSRNAVYTQIWIAICDYLLLIIAKMHYGLEPSLHTISNSIGQILFKRGDIREMYYQPSFPVIVPEAAYGRQLTLW